MILHVGLQNKNYQSGVYAYGTVVYGPYILEDSPTEYCNGKRTVDVRIDKISNDMPMITHEQCKRYTGQYRSVHRIFESFDEAIKRDLGIP